MTNPRLARDYLSRSRKRLKAIETLFAEEAFADVFARVRRWWNCC